MKHFELNEYLKDLETLVNIDSGMFYKPGVDQVVEFFTQKYEALGLKVEKKYCEKDEDRSRPFLQIRNSDSERIDLMFVGHMDTVFAVGTAAERPFSIDEEGIVRGPGCLDCKGGCLATYYLIKSLMEEGRCNFNFCVCMNSDEEKGSKMSRAFFEEIAAKSDNCFVMEPARVNGEYVHQRKGGNNYIIHCHGISAHSGVNPQDGASAILELSKWVVDLYKWFNLEEGTTINIGRFDGGADNGSVPDYAEFTISFRVLKPEVVTAFEEYIIEKAKTPYDPRVTVEVEKVAERPAMFPHEKTVALLNLLKEAGEENDYKVESVMTGGGSDGNFIAHFGTATIDGCGPQGANLHTDKEYLVTSNLEKRLDVLATLIGKMFG